MQTSYFEWENERQLASGREAVAILHNEMTRTGRADLQDVLKFAEQVTEQACG